MANILTHVVQTNFLSGVLDPRVQGRVDTSAYIASLLEGTNIELQATGGLSRRRGSVHAHTMPPELTQLIGTYTVPEGAAFAISPYGNGVYTSVGAPANATIALGSQQWGLYLTTTTTPVGVIDPYVVAQIDLGYSYIVAFADITCFSLSGGSSVDFNIQFSNDGTNWTTAQSLQVPPIPQVDAVNGTAGYAYRLLGSPNPYRYWRLARTGSAFNLGSAVVSLGDFTLWGATNTVSTGRLIPFEVSTGEQYALVLTDHSGLIVAAGVQGGYDAGAPLQQLPMPYAMADLPLVDVQSSAETLCLVHEAYQPMFVIRQNSPLILPVTGGGWATYYNFQPFPIIFDAIPQIYYADNKSPVPTSDIQTLSFGSGWNIGDSFTITLLTDTTGPIIYAGDDYTKAGNTAGVVGSTSKAIATALQALWAINGFTGVSCVSGSSAYGYVVTFAGAAAAPIGVMSISCLSTGSTGGVVETQVGITAQENLWSPIRGYPGVCTFFQGRLYLGGFQSQQESVAGSQVDNILNFATAQGLDDQAIYITMSGVALNAINGLFPGKSLCVFTTGGEFRFVNDQNQPIIPTSAPQAQTQYGSAHIKAVMIDGNIVFVQRNLKSIRDFQFDYTVDQFNSLGISILASNLVYNVNDIAAWQGSLSEEINYVFVCNGTNPSTDFDAYPDGSMSVFNTRKEVGMQAWVNWQTQGLYQNACCVVENILFLVQRTIGGVTSLFLEIPTEGTFTDCNYVADVTKIPDVTFIAGLTWLEGASVRIIADGYVLDTQTVVNGTVQLVSNGQPYTATKYIEVGLNFNPTVTPMPLQTVRWPAGSNLAHKKRIVGIRIKVRETQGLLVDGNDIQLNQLDNFNMDSGPLPLYTGIVELEESTNWEQDLDKLVTFTQVDPLPMQLLYMDVTLSGEQ